MDNRKYLKKLCEYIGWGVVDWTDLVQDRDHWRILMNTVMNFGFHKMLRNS
jgi:hypothetical protein